jgi:hypothetical protein
MKWYFALNEMSLRDPNVGWESMILTAVRTCRQHTDLKPHFLFDGGDDPFLGRLEAEGVTVIRHRVSVWDAIAAHWSGHDGPLRIASGTFMRVDIPALETDDEFVLYTDCDVMFTGPIELGGHSPQTFACVPEFDLNEPDALNAGVMLMNVPALRAELAEFREFISTHLADFAVYDQDAYRAFYQGRTEPLPVGYNWRPYWGVYDEARIVHFHGPKPPHALRMLLDDGSSLPEIYRALVDQNPQGYRHYLGQWLAAAGEASAWM